jgi:hypothetical protein
MKRLRYYSKILPVLFVLIIGCFDLPQDIIMPEWDVDINVPLTNKTYTIYDMFKPQSKFSITSALTNEDFYLVQSDNYITNSEVADYIQLLDQGSVSQNFLIPANIPALSVFIVFPEEIEIDHATFISGFLSFAIQNPSAGPITSSIRVPGIRKPDGSELIVETTVAAFSRDSIIYNLSNHQYVLPASQPIQNKNSLQVVASANSQMSGAFENVNLYLYNFNFSSITGSLPRTSLGNKRTSSSFNLNDVADYRGKIFIKEGTLNLRSEYVSAHQNIFELEISDIKIVGRRNTGEEKLLIRNDGQSINFRLTNGVYDLTLNESNSNLTEFISFLPDSVVISSEYILNPLNDHVTRTVTNRDSIKFAIQFTTKSIFAVKQINYIDTLAIDLSQDDRDKIRDGVGADLNVHLENAIPIDAFVKATLTDEYYSPLFTITKNQYGVDSLQFLGGQVDNNTGQIISPTVTLNTIKLDSTKIRQLSNARYVIISATLNTKNATNENPNPPTVQFKSSDWLNIKCYGKVKYHIGSEEK